MLLEDITDKAIIFAQMQAATLWRDYTRSILTAMLQNCKAIK